MRFEWDSEKADTNEAQHGVSFNEARGVFSDPNAIKIYDEDHSTSEDRFIIIGLSAVGLLTVVYTERQHDVYRIISAWHATTRETRIYEGQE
jgi:uncharacterized DUF497 family protein